LAGITLCCSSSLTHNHEIVHIRVAYSRAAYVGTIALKLALLISPNLYEYEGINRLLLIYNTSL
jgi:hypothetical protein